MSDPTQAQAEDRRAQIEDRLDAYDRARFFGGGFGPQWEGFAPVAADLYRNAPADIAWLLSELSRLSRVEQAALAVNEAVRATEDHVQWFPALAKLLAALSASPSSQSAAAALRGETGEKK